MWVNTTENMNNSTGNESLASLSSKMIPLESDLLRTLSLNGSYKGFQNSEAIVNYGTYYTLYIIIAILVFLLIIMIYFYFFSWVLKVFFYI